MNFSDQLDDLLIDLGCMYETELEHLRYKSTPVFDETVVILTTRFLGTPSLGIEWPGCLGEHYPVIDIDLEGQTVRWFTFNCHKVEDCDEEGSEREDKEFGLWDPEGWDYVNRRLEELRLRREVQC